jgi:hypothetical protein
MDTGSRGHPPATVSIAPTAQVIVFSYGSNLSIIRGNGTVSLI